MLAGRVESCLEAVMWEIEFWKAVADRAVRSLAYALIAAISVGGVSAGFGDVAWGQALSQGGVAAILSVLVSITVNQATGTGPALTKAEKVVAAPEVHGRHERPDVT
jgi:hypothetical protein